MSGAEGSFVVCRVELSNQFARQLEEGLLEQLRRVLDGLQLPGWPSWTFQVKEDALEMCWGEPLRLSEEVQRYMQELIYVEIARLASLRQEHVVRMELDADFLHLVSGPNEPVLSMLVRDLGVEINVSSAERGVVVVEIRGTPDAVEDAQQVLAWHLHYLWSRPPGLSLAERQLAEETDQRVSIFVDDSNITLGCELLPSGRDYDQRLSIPDFSDVVAGVRTVDLRVVGDLQRRTEHQMWRCWNVSRFWVEWKLSLATCVLWYVKALERHGADRKRSVLALCTSDESLADIVEYIAGCGWQVEIWCWRATSSPAYEALAAKLMEVNMCYLDGFRCRITMPCRPRHFQPLADDPETPCIICLSAEAAYALRPCNHRVLCPSCLPGWMEHRPRRTSCPMCRKTFNHMQLAVGQDSKS